jgi:ribosomal protein S18 acetylase RimI-like enzyme
VSAALHLAKPADITAIMPLVAAFHAEDGISVTTDDTRQAALMPLLEGSPMGAVYLIGLPRAPIGYIVITFGWSVEFGGMDAFVDELYVRPGVRGRGVASKVLQSLGKALGNAGIKALHLEVENENITAQRLYRRNGFMPRDRYMLMSRTLG